MKAELQNYPARTWRLLDYIDQHLGGDLGLETVNGVAAFYMDSKEPPASTAIGAGSLLGSSAHVEIEAVTFVRRTDAPRPLARDHRATHQLSPVR